MTTPILDFERLLAYVGDEPSARQLLGVLEGSLSQDLPRLQAFIDAGDLAAAQGLLHQLKGFVPVFCGPDMVGRVTALEALSKGTDLDAVHQVHQQLAPELEQLLREARAQL